MPAFLFSGRILHRYIPVHCVVDLLRSWNHTERSNGRSSPHVYTKGT